MKDFFEFEVEELEERIAPDVRAVVTELKQLTRKAQQIPKEVRSRKGQYGW